STYWGVYNTGGETTVGIGLQNYAESCRSMRRIGVGERLNESF
ncbi:MAG: hypothetical protein RIQ79_2673, partial [Verrucomicrobiota bacterium]